MRLLHRIVTSVFDNKEPGYMQALQKARAGLLQALFLRLSEEIELILASEQQEEVHVTLTGCITHEKRILEERTQVYLSWELRIDDKKYREGCTPVIPCWEWDITSTQHDET